MFIAATVLLMALTPGLAALGGPLLARLPSLPPGKRAREPQVPGRPAGSGTGTARMACRSRAAWCSWGTARTPAWRPAP